MAKITLVNLGCPKNLVDSEVVLGILEKAGYEICEDITKSDIMLLNTCAFIEEAKQESIDLILQMAQIKKDDPKKRLVVLGCIVKRYLQELKKNLPEVDLWVTSSQIPILPELIKNAGKTVLPSAEPYFLYSHSTPRVGITPAHYAYIKISEGCKNLCSYCAVPGIKGPYKSREFKSIITEAGQLIDRGVKEIILIAQDTTSYGCDNPKQGTLTDLIKELCKESRLNWLRILYMHPAHVTDTLINEIASQPKICKYIDLPLQHIDDEILFRMRRKIGRKEITKLITFIRSVIPEVVLRTSFIVGFPGETEEQFNLLLDFMEEIGFDRLGIFKYSREEGTDAYNMSGRISKAVKEKRFHKAMLIQQKISKEVNKRFLNRHLQVIIDGVSDTDNRLLFGRSYADAPEVDGLVYVKNVSGRINIGDIIKAKITDTKEYDLVGEKA